MNKIYDFGIWIQFLSLQQNSMSDGLCIHLFQMISKYHLDFIFIIVNY